MDEGAVHFFLEIHEFLKKAKQERMEQKDFTMLVGEGWVDKAGDGVDECDGEFCCCCCWALQVESCSWGMTLV